MRTDAAIGYVRVSTDEQANDGVSLDVQVAKIKGYCKVKDLTLIGIYGDPGISGKAIDIRPGLKAVLDMVGRKRIGHVVVWRKDRLSRKAIDTLQIAETMDKNDVSFHSITDSVDTKTAVGKLFFQIQAALAEYERNQIAERVQAAMDYLKANGGKVSSEAPYGYHYEQTGTKIKRDGSVVPVFKSVEDDAEQDCICLLYRLHNENPDWGLRKFARELAKRGCLNRNGVSFHPESIKGMLSSSRICVRTIQK